jgi:hypothetical protein
MQENNVLNSLREELNDLVISEEAVLHEGEILKISQQLDEVIVFYYGCKKA